MSIYVDLPFHLSSDLNLDLKVFISKIKVPELCWKAAESRSVFLEHKPSPESCYVSLQVVCDGVGVHSVAKSTRLPEASRPWLCYEEWLTLPVKIRDLPPTSQLVRRFYESS